MGRHILLFMMSLGTAFAYLLLQKYLPTRPMRIIGWNIVIGLVTVVVWWRVIILIIFQVKHEEGMYKLVRKVFSIFRK